MNLYKLTINHPIHIPTPGTSLIILLIAFTFSQVPMVKTLNSNNPSVK